MSGASYTWPFIIQGVIEHISLASVTWTALPHLQESLLFCREVLDTFTAWKWIFKGFINTQWCCTRWGGCVPWCSIWRESLSCSWWKGWYKTVGKFICFFSQCLRHVETTNTFPIFTLPFTSQRFLILCNRWKIFLFYLNQSQNNFGLLQFLI